MVTSSLVDLAVGAFPDLFELFILVELVRRKHDSIKLLFLSNQPHPHTYSLIYHQASLLLSFSINCLYSDSTLFRLSNSTCNRSISDRFSLSKLFSSRIFFFLFSGSCSTLFLSPMALSFCISIFLEKTSRVSLSCWTTSSMAITLLKMELPF